MRNGQLTWLVAAAGATVTAFGCSNVAPDAAGVESAISGSRVTVSIVDGAGQAQDDVTVAAEDGYGNFRAADRTDGFGNAVFFLGRGSYRFSVGKSYPFHPFKPPCGSVPFFSGEPRSCSVPGCRTARIVIKCPDANPCAGKPDGTACSDGNACTSNDVCLAGVCAGAPVVCQGQDQCHDAGTCDPATGACSPVAKAEGAACDDGNACTQSDSCQAGVCTGGNPVICSASDQCHDVGACDPATGACSAPAKTDGTACDDGNACTQTDSCQLGSCEGSNPVVCQAADQCHDVGTCDPSSGICSNPATAEGTPCSDGNACTPTDVCLAGMCIGASLVTCAALDQCHVAGTCDSSTGTCSNPAAGDGTACNDGNACTRADSCQSGACVGASPVACASADQCHVPGVCDPSSGTCTNPARENGSACNDGNACTQADSCQAGVCQGASPVVCAAQDQCHVAGTCDRSTGVCSNPAAANGTACGDGNGCTQRDVCQDGTCTGTEPVTCLAQDQCHVAGTCDPATGSCSNPAAANGTACDDGDACSRQDTCQGGACTGSDGVVCVAQDQCHVAGTCDPLSGSCSNPVATNGTLCHDGNACTLTDSCQNGGCVGSNPVVCLALDQCHVPGSCDPASGTCSNLVKPDGASCDDNNGCTGGDICRVGICIPGVQTCANLAVAETNFFATVTPQMTMTLAVDKPAAVPGDLLTFTSDVTNTGSFLDLRGVVTIANNGPNPFTVLGYQQTLEYFSPGQQAWIPLAGSAFDANGNLIASADRAALTFSARALGQAGVTYSADPVVGTSIGPGATAAWVYGLSGLLAPATVNLLFDPAQASKIRTVIRFDVPTGGVANPGDIDLTTALAGVTGAVNGLQITVEFTGGGGGVIGPSADPLRAGATTTLSGPVVAPAIAPRSSAETDIDYLNRLSSATTFGYFAGARASGHATGGDPPSPSASARLGALLPIVSAQKSGPLSALLGDILHYSVGLQNTGTADAGPFTIVDSVDGVAVSGLVVLAPDTLAPQQSGTATFDLPVPLGRPVGALTDFVSVAWRDRNGNFYGPVSSSFTTTLLGF